MAFTDVYSVKASNQMQYNCVVAAGNTNYYRVIETDIDGVKTFSKIVPLQSTASSIISIYPNPANNMLYIKGIENYVQLQVINMLGNIVQQQMITSVNQSLNISNLSKGTYLLKLINTSGVQTLKFAKQ